MKINIFKKKIFRDNRGIIADVIYKNQINHIGYISSKKNSIRGNHYHKKTSQYNFVLDGVINYYSKTKKQKKIKIIKLKKGDLILTKPNEIHAFKTISSKSIFMVFTVGIRGGKDYEKDTYRVESIVK
ncbi:cupin domain-containing protein [Candidatus Pelagibacter sp.]|nr:cupin domain-containing protein [Candidatus Pelagibacter sp.]